ncbi:MAG: FAD:protein FMN transferase [Candidatus Omnitrophica bacterium]|nr:FAD:protein FMN transferase [Candidatus Omnitrophota bacterium]
MAKKTIIKFIVILTFLSFCLFFMKVNDNFYLKENNLRGFSSIFNRFPKLTRRVYKHKFIVAGTYLTVNSSSPYAGRIVYQEFKRLDKIFNIYDPNSEISKVNSTYNIPIRVSSELIEVLELAYKTYQLTDGSFDVSKGILYKFWKNFIKGKKIDKFPDKEEIEDLVKLGGMEFIGVDKNFQTVTIKKEGLMIDLSGIAKGYMVDKAVEKLKKKGIDSAIVDAGGDIYCLGKNYHTSWKVGIRDPLVRDGIIDIIPVVDQAIATSGSYEQFFTYASQNYTHIINPKTGYPLDDKIISVTVIAKNCTTADALATAFFVMGYEKIKEFLAKENLGVKVFLVMRDGKGKRIYIL